MDAVLNYLNQVWKAITRPVIFFRELPTEGGLAAPLTFALITHWIGNAVGFLWTLALKTQLNRWVDWVVDFGGDLAEVDHPGRRDQWLEVTEKLREWFFSGSTIILDPFFTLGKVLLISTFVYIGARIFVTPGRTEGPTEITYESALRVVCYGLAPSILAAIPGVGGLISSILVFFTTLVAAKEVYRISSSRAMFVAFFPQMLVFSAILFVFFAFAILIIKTVLSIF